MKLVNGKGENVKVIKIFVKGIKSGLFLINSKGASREEQSPPSCMHGDVDIRWELDNQSSINVNIFRSLCNLCEVSLQALKCC